MVARLDEQLALTSSMQWSAGYCREIVATIRDGARPRSTNIPDEYAHLDVIRFLISKREAPVDDPQPRYGVDIYMKGQCDHLLSFDNSNN